MRLAIAMIAMLTATLFLGFGLARQTILKPTDYGQFSFVASAGYSVLPKEFLDRFPRTLLRAEIQPADGGDKDLFKSKAGAYIASAPDVYEWVSDAAYSKASYEEGQISWERQEGNDPMEFLARDHDLFIDQVIPGDKTRIDLPINDREAILLQSPVALQVNLFWWVSTADPLVFPALALAVFLVIFGLVFYFWPWGRGGRRRRRSTFVKRHAKVSAGRSRGRRPRGRSGGSRAAKSRAGSGRGTAGRRRSFTAAALVPALLLSACTTETSPPAQNTVSAQEQWAKKITQRLVRELEQADAALDLGLAERILSGEALRMRQSAYAVLRKDSSAEVEIPKLDPAAGVKLILPERTDNWPKSMMLVVDSAPGANGEKLSPIALYIRQNTPRHNYLIDYLVRLMPNTSLPNVPAAQVGSRAIPSGSRLLTIVPDELVSKYSSILGNPEAADAQLFAMDKDTVANEMRSNRHSKESNLSGNAEITFTDVSIGEIGLTTADGGGLVFVSMSETETVKSQGNYRIVPQSGGLVSLISGVNSSAKGIETVYGNQFLFYVPTVGSGEKAVLLGYSRGIVSAKEISE